MTNPVKGEVHFEARGQSWTFKLGTNAQVLIETKTGMTMVKFVKDRFEDLGAADVRLIFWAGLYRQHQLTEDDVGDMIDEMGPDAVAKIFVDAFESAKVKTDAAKDNGAAALPRPTKPAKAQIGMNS
jgi:hypothetical protein